MTNNGWIKLYIKTVDNPIWQRDRVAWKVFEYLLFRAYADKSQPPGKLVTTRQQIADACFGNSSTIYKALKRLEKAEMITTSVTTKYTLVSICNWEKYQGSGNSFSNNKVTTKEQQSNSLNKNIDIRIKNNNNAPADADIVENLLNESGPIKYEWQELGLKIFEMTGAPASKRAECMRLAKTLPIEVIMGALSFVKDYPGNIAKWKMFLWKLKNEQTNSKISS